MTRRLVWADPSLRVNLRTLVCPFCGRGPFAYLVGHTWPVHALGANDLRERGIRTRSPEYDAYLAAEAPYYEEVEE